MKTNGKKKKSFFNKGRSVAALVLCLAMLFGFGMPLWSQENQEAPEFLEELLILLQAKGFSAEQIEALKAGAVDYEGIEEADPEIVALALEFGKEEAEGLGAEYLAALVYELASSCLEMEALGYEEKDIARTTFNSMRNIIADIENWGDSAEYENLDELISVNFAQEMKIASFDQMDSYMRDRIAEFMELAGEYGIPFGSSGFFDDYYSGSSGPNFPW